MISLYIQTFTTLETLTNANSAKKWLLDTAKDVCSYMCIYVTLYSVYNGVCCLSPGVSCCQTLCGPLYK